MEFHGLHDEDEEQKYFEYGAHFRYQDLVEALKYLQNSQIYKNEKVSEEENSINIINNNSNYNEVYNQINKQLCQKMTDIIPPNKFIQSRNIKPLIQSLSQKLTDIIQSQNNKKPVRHYVTKKRQINSKIKNNNNINSNNIINKNIAKTNLENKKNEKKNFGINQPYKKKEISQSKNLLNYKKPLSKNNDRNAQFNINKKNNLIPQDGKHFVNANAHNKIIQSQNKNINNNINKNNEKMYGTVIDNNNNNSKKVNNNSQNTQTVQNIILKSNINISFINNFNTTYLHKSKKKQKKIRSRNNQELTKLNMIENKVININNNIKLEEDDDNSRISKNKVGENITNKGQNSNKEIKKKTPLMSPKLKYKEINNHNGDMKKKIILANQNVKIKQNIFNNFINKDKQEKGNINGVNKKRVSSGLNINKNDNNKKLMYNFIGKVKLHM
jgi:hypothetical protein